MPTVRFIAQGKRETVNIYIRLRDGRETDIKLPTGITLTKDHWSKPRNWISPKADFHNKPQIESRLRELKKLVHDGRNSRVSNGLTINRDWLESVIGKWQGKQMAGLNDGLIDLIKEYQQVLPNKVRQGKKGVSQGAIKNYNTTIGRLKKFETATKKSYRTIEIDLTFHAQYVKYATEQLGLAVNSIGKDIKNIKTVCRFARDKGIRINEQSLFGSFSAPSEKAKFVTLSIDDLERIRQVRGSGYIENARDWLIIGCWTGCRFGDLMKLTKDNLKDHKSGGVIIQYTQSKTKKLVNVPIHSHVWDVIDRLDGFPRPISNVNFNAYIKEVGKKAGLVDKVNGTRQNPKTHLNESRQFEKWELIRSHICRRSFATNHYSKMTNKEIMAVTGHLSERQLLDYIGETEIDHVESYLTLWRDDVKRSLRTKDK